MADINKITQKIDKMVSQNSVNFDDIIVKTLEASSNYIQLKNMSITSMLKENSKDIDKNNEIQKIFQDAEKDGIAAEPDRLGKYTDYDDILNKLPIVGASVNTLVDNIITPDNNFSNIFKFDYSFSEITSEYKNTISLMKNIIDEHDIDIVVDQMARNLVTYGCYFVEIKNTKQALYKYQVLQDSEDKVQSRSNKPQLIEKIFTLIENEDKTQELLEFSDVYGTLLEDTNPQEMPDDEVSSTNEIQLNVIHPKNVVVVYTSNLILGYLVIIPTQGNVTPNQQLAKDILEKLFMQSNMPNIKKLISANPQYEAYISNLLNSYDTGISDIKAKFVPVDMMIHNFIGEFPYGTSRLEPVRTLGKYAIIGNASNMLYRFTRAPDIRIFKVDVGMDHDSAKYIQQIKGELMQRKYAVDMSTDVDTLTKQLTQFEDLWIPTKQGQEFFSVDVIPSGDLQSKNDDLKFLQDQIVSGLDTPPNYLGLDRSEDSRYTLSQMNAKFAKTIQRLSKVVSKGVDKMVKNIYNQTVKDNLPIAQQIKISLYPPTALLLERLAEIYGNVSTVMQSLETLKLPQELFLKEFVPWIDFDQLDDANLDQKIKDITKPKSGGDSGNDDDGGGDLF